jgi:hypothetical protein
MLPLRFFFSYCIASLEKEQLRIAVPLVSHERGEPSQPGSAFAWSQFSKIETRQRRTDNGLVPASLREDKLDLIDLNSRSSNTSASQNSVVLNM